jgi:dUTP pyrophosphatase
MKGGQSNMVLKVKYLPNFKEEWKPLKQAREGDAGFDLRAAIPVAVRLSSNFVLEIPTGICIELPRHHELQIRPRGGQSKEGLIIANSPGTVDCGYRGEIIVLVRSTESGLKIMPGERIAQAVVQELPLVIIEEVDELSDSERGEGKLSSTGVY